MSPGLWYWWVEIRESENPPFFYRFAEIWRCRVILYYIYQVKNLCGRLNYVLNVLGLSLIHISRDNEISILRKEDISMAYYGCHTDITIPYEELGSIRVIDEDGEGTSIIENGRFVLPGTEELNRPFEK